MSALTMAAPATLGLLALVLIFIAYHYRRSDAVGWFEVFFAFGNLFLLSAVFAVFYGLQSEGDSFSSVVFPIFQASMWIYFFIVLFIFMKFLKHLVFGLWATVKNRGKR